MAVKYEWVVEQMDGDEIGDCHYYDEADLAKAKAHAADLIADGHVVDFGLCRTEGDDVVGETDRQYAYLSEGALPSLFDYGASVPKRFSHVNRSS